VPRNSQHPQTDDESIQTVDRFSRPVLTYLHLVDGVIELTDDVETPSDLGMLRIT